MVTDPLFGIFGVFQCWSKLLLYLEPEFLFLPTWISLTQCDQTTSVYVGQLDNHCSEPLFPATVLRIKLKTSFGTVVRAGWMAKMTLLEFQIKRLVTFSTYMTGTI